MKFPTCTYTTTWLANGETAPHFFAETYRAADYVELMVPRFGPIDSQLAC